MARNTLNACLLFALAAVSAGCASGRRVTPKRTDYGAYHFRESVLNTRPAVVLEGEVHLTPDSINIVLMGSPCVYDQRSRDQRYVRYVCGVTTFSFDRMEPLKRNSYSVKTSQLVVTETCTQRNAAGACIGWMKRTDNVDVTRTGSISVVTP